MSPLSDHKSRGLEAEGHGTLLFRVRNMKLATPLSALFFAALLCLSLSLRTSAQQPQEWTWKDAKGHPRSRKDLEAILKQHKLWLDSDGKSGTRAELGGANLNGASLSGADLSRANLTGACLTGANLNGASLNGANLDGAFLNDANLDSAFLYEADLRSADFEPANLPTLERIAAGASLGPDAGRPQGARRGQRAAPGLHSLRRLRFHHGLSDGEAPA
jgi:hypothetical protein